MSADISIAHAEISIPRTSYGKNYFHKIFARFPKTSKKIKKYKKNFKLPFITYKKKQKIKGNQKDHYN